MIGARSVGVTATKAPLFYITEMTPTGGGKKMKYWQILLELWDKKTWIENEDFRKATHGSPKLTSRISDLRKKGVEIVSAKKGNYNVYALVTPREDVVEIMSKRRSA